MTTRSASWPLLSRLPVRHVTAMPGRASHPVARVLLGLVMIVLLVILVIVAIVAVILDILLLPFRLLFGRRRRTE